MDLEYPLLRRSFVRRLRRPAATVCVCALGEESSLDFYCEDTFHSILLGKRTLEPFRKLTTRLDQQWMVLRTEFS